MIRVISGQFKGRQLFYPQKSVLRPTQDKVKQALFNILQGYVEEARVLDLCCGTGGLGIEALSRGASQVVFVDTDTSWVKKNLNHCGIQSEAECYEQSALSFLKRKAHVFDLVFLDPPWVLKTEQNWGEKRIKNPDYDLEIRPSRKKTVFNIQLYESILQNLATQNWVKTLLVCEHHIDMKVAFPELFSVMKQAVYGDTVLTLLSPKV